MNKKEVMLRSCPQKSTEFDINNLEFEIGDYFNKNFKKFSDTTNNFDDDDDHNHKNFMDLAKSFTEIK